MRLVLSGYPGSSRLFGMNDRYGNPWRTLSRRRIYDNAWIRVREDQVIRPDGAPGIYGVVEFKNRAVGVLPIDERGNTWLVGQYRYTLDRYSWEIPEGGCPEGEAPEEAARRELLEEAGLEARSLQLLGTAHLSNSVTDEVAFYYLATDLIARACAPEGTERLELLYLPFDEALEMALKGKITDALSLLAILHYARAGYKQNTEDA